MSVPSANPPRFRFVLIAGVCFSGALLAQIVAAEAGGFNRTGSTLMVIAGLALAATVAISLLADWIWISTSTDQTNPRSISKTGIGCAVLAIAASVIYVERWVHPTENIVGGYDEAIYAITAANLAQTGHYRLHAALVPTLPNELNPWVIAQFPRMGIRSEKIPARSPAYHACLFIENGPDGTLVSQFPIGFPALLGSAYAIDGFDGQRWVNPIALFTAACIAGLLVTSWLGLLPGAATFVLWLWLPLQVWGGNSRFAEVLLQLLWLLALLALAGRTRNPLWSGALAGLALGVSLAVKIDALPVLTITALVAVIATFRHERTFLWSFLAALLVSSAISTTALWQDNRTYALDTLRSSTEISQHQMLGGIALIVASGLAWAGMHYSKRWRKTKEFWSGVRPWLVRGAVGVSVGVAAYAYFIRSNPKIPDTFFYWPQSSMIRSYREDTFMRLGWYWQPWGLAIAVIGVTAFMRTSQRIWHWLAVGIGLLYLVAFAYDIRNNPIQPYAMRRFLPYALPLMILGAAVLESWLPQKWPRARPWLTTAVTVGLLIGFWPVNERLNAKTEYAGLIDQVGVLAEKIPGNAVVLFSGNDPLARMASCLEFVHGKPSLIVRRQLRLDETGVVLRRACELWTKQGRRVFVLSTQTRENFKMPGVIADPTDHGIIRMSAIQPSDKILVTTQTPLDVPYTLNELRLLSPLPLPATPHHSP